MLETKNIKEKEYEKRLDILGQALQQVCGERKEANDLVERWKHTANYYFDRYHLMRVEVVKTILCLKDASEMIDVLLNGGKPKLPGIDIASDDLDVV